jgi:UDP-N-acetylmuramoylalanine--D-glutamate ligase
MANISKKGSAIRALVMGLGLHGGGVATSKWLASHGCEVTATDLRSKDILAPSIRALGKNDVRLVLGKHDSKDFRENDLIVVNPGVPRESKYLAIARKSGKRIENDASIFFANITNPVIAVTGTRGKTTTALWIAELLKQKHPAVRPSGNTPDNALLKEYDRVNGRDVPVVAELSSWQLEYLPISGRAPHIAVITNLFRDHLNRYGGSMEAYADAKANIFKDQEPHDALILDRDNAWWKYFVRKDPRGQLFFVSRTRLPKGVPGLYPSGHRLIFRDQALHEHMIPVNPSRFSLLFGEHNLSNLLSAILAVHLFDPLLRLGTSDALRLPAPRMRQEMIARRGRLMIVNDSCATSPDGTIAAIERFNKQGSVILIAGGTDKDLDFDSLSRMIKKHVGIDHTVVLEGSATTKLLVALQKQKLSRRNLDKRVQKNLDSCVKEAFQIAKSIKGKTVILFSPGAASFEKFLHEFDRGEKFNRIAKKYLRD